VCQLKDYRPRQIATLFGQVTLRLPRFRCAGCGTMEAACRLAIRIDIGERIPQGQRSPGEFEGGAHMRLWLLRQPQR
jgi:hypothetical protein